MRRRRSGQSGFTLLEVVVAMAILVMALMAIFNLNSGAIAMHGYTKRLTVASLLARSKMTDLEQQLYDDGFSVDDEEEDGDFSDEGWPNFKWRAKIIAPQTEGLPPEQLLGALFGMPIGGGEGDDGLSGLMSMFGGGTDAQGGGAAGGAAAMAAGPMAGMMQTQITQMVDQITKNVREVQLTVYWKDGTEVESIDLVTHIVSSGPGSDRNGGPGGGTASSQDPNNPGDMVDAVTGAPVPNPQNGINPATGNPVIPRAQWLQMQAQRQMQQGNPLGQGGLKRPFGNGIEVQKQFGRPPRGDVE